MIARAATVVIENIHPLIEGGRYPVKRIVGDDFVVEADIFKDGHDVVTACLKWRRCGATRWHQTQLQPIGNDRWRGVCAFYENGLHEYTLEAWGDTFLSWQHEFSKKFDAGLPSLQSETLEGKALFEAAAKRATSKKDKRRLGEIAQALDAATPAEVATLIHTSEVEALMAAWPDRSLATSCRPTFKVWVDRPEARFAAWYEFFPRSAAGDGERGSTFRECLPRIDDARAMGFDVIYFPPIHPIGFAARKGRNNSVTSQPGEPGVPYAIGNRHQGTPNGGGHRDVAPELGTLEDFDWLVGEIRERGMEIALDFAINCSPDHPYVHEHPDWFFKRPDGTIKYAENPPKKYEDVYPLNFQNADWKRLWEELTDVVRFWVLRGVRIFRVDNPHTKPVAFWEHLIGSIHATHPDVIFLSEAFTRPKMMRVLAKAGFSQSYTYFTWRNTRAELTEYFTELTQSEMKEYFRANLWPNTPDILPTLLQHGGRPAFLSRFALSATLSPVYGIYSGYELCENAAVPGKEEYLDSEKYQFKARDWDAPGNIKAFITRINAIRKENRALHQERNLRFLHSENDQILAFAKATDSRDNQIVVIVNLDPHHAQTGFIHLPADLPNVAPGQSYEVHDLLSGERYAWQGERNYVALDPWERPVHLLRITHCATL